MLRVSVSTPGKTRAVEEGRTGKHNRAVVFRFQKID